MDNAFGTREVWKYRLSFGTQWQAIEIPGLARSGWTNSTPVVYVDEQLGMPAIWALVNPTDPPQVREFCVRGTGSPIPDDAIYRGSYQSGPLVWHVFERSA
jgi:hypothetical protein